MHHLRVLVLLLGGMAGHIPAWGATVWQPTDNNLNYAYLAGPSPAAVNFALFDFNETLQAIDTGASLAFAPGDQISILLLGGGFQAANDSQTAIPNLFLGSSDRFVIGANEGGGWVFDDGAPTLLGTNLSALKFVFPGSSSILLQVDAAAVGTVTTVTTVIPVPGAALLLGSGLLLIGSCWRMPRLAGGGRALQRLVFS